MIEPVTREFQVGRSKTRHGLVVAALGILVGVGALLFTDESAAGGQWVAALLIVLGIGVGVHAWRSARPSAAHLRIDAAGVTFREWGATVPWREIADVYQSGSRVQPFITLRVGDPDRFLAALPPEEARALRRNRLWKPPELRIPYNAVEASRDEVLAAIQSGLESEAGNPPVA